MFKTILTSASLTAAAIAGIAASPAMAQSHYQYTERYDGDDGSYYRSETYHEEDGDRGYDRGYRDYDRRPVHYQDGYERDEYVRERPVHRARPRYTNCSSGTTGTVVGGVLGGLLGREIGRGGRWNRPSTTGLILGAGAGALAGRAIEQDGCR
ncbi:glycine zipper 2TM domain-containing protein [Sphingobium bisphenolivorans]|uniref:glycine zipper 2TM domain-containing protein n=1 Tax=Sphingobium bisphenolivorans TaxID=1335760 RepID=UPI0003A4E3A0|nr:glycine zipper 2TM domain-containing protein [Sphingobium bisphenolivorans]